MILPRTVGRLFFKFRDYLPLLLIFTLIKSAKPAKFGWLAGLPVILVGQIIRVWSLMHIGPSSRTREICAAELVTTGPYRLCRNPLYYANSLKIIGILLIAGSFRLAVQATIFYTLEFCTIIPYEEDFLRQSFPDQFDKYCSQTPAFIPQYKPEAFTDSSRFSLRDAIVSEKQTFRTTGGLLLVLLLAAIFRRKSDAAR